VGSPRALFQTVVDENAPRTTREAAIEDLEALNATTQLRVVVTAGLDGRYRRQAMNALERCDAVDELGVLAEDTSLAGPLRTRAAELR
jgi:hypothetical protein